MIISLRGTNGAGKSTIVRAVMDTYPSKQAMWSEGRRKPFGYTLRDPARSKLLFIPGHYEIANGGIDTLKDLDEAYDLICAFHGQGYHVLYEGKNMSDGCARVFERIPPDIATIIHVAHPVEECIQSVRDRGHSIQEKTIRSIRNRVEKSMEQFLDRGYYAINLQREAALVKVKELLA